MCLYRTVRVIGFVEWLDWRGAGDEISEGERRGLVPEP